MKDHIAIGEDKKTGLFHGLLFVSKPTPSGCDRPILSKSTTLGYISKQQALEAIKSMLDPEYIKKIDVPYIPGAGT